MPGAGDELKEESIAARSGEGLSKVPEVKTAGIELETMCNSAAPVQPVYNSVYNCACEMQPMYQNATGNSGAVTILSALEFCQVTRLYWNFLSCWIL